MIKREEYLSKLRIYKNQPLIKVITGIRRAGKSTLLTLYKNELLESGVFDNQIQYINFEDPDNSEYLNWEILYKEIKSNLKKDEMNYIFLDEIQWVDQFERVINGLNILENVDVYITGSNSWFLSSELATILTGRYVTIHVLPFSFKEFLQATGDDTSLDSKFIDYMTYGGFPLVSTLYNIDVSGINDYLRSIYDTVFIKDIMTRKRVSDPSALQAVTAFMFDNIGNISNSNTIANTMTSSGRKISYHTVDSYLLALSESFILYPVQRYDVKGKKLLKTNHKYYLVDTGLRQMLLGREKMSDRGHLLENVIYFELLRRGYEVWIGKNDSYEIDFVAKNREGYIEYYQVAYSVRSDETLKRELEALKRIKDHNHKYLISLDPEEADYDGIKQVNAIKFLLSQ